MISILPASDSLDWRNSAGDALPRTRKRAVSGRRSASTLLMGHRSLATTARYLRIATSTVCSTTSPLDLLPRPVSAEPKPEPPKHF